jgi:glycosyltransferase involved in cell wall biosynthesis
MISMVVPTRNRAHTLRLVAPSYYEQAGVSEIIFVSDAGDDPTPEVIDGLAKAYPATRTIFLRNPTRLGASESRNVGVRRATSDYILFCDDDEYLERGYAETCLAKLVALDAAAVSGRRIYMLDGETQAAALARFGNGLRRVKPYRKVICEYTNSAIYEGDMELPLTNAVILTRADLLRRFPFDGYYARGNGYREETDFQMNLFVHGYRIFATNACHSLHLPPSKVRTGGQRTKPWLRVYWAVFFTNYMFGRYFKAYARRLGIATPRWAALMLFTLYVIYREFLLVPLYRLWMPLVLKLRDRGQGTLAGGLPPGR